MFTSSLTILRATFVDYNAMECYSNHLLLLVRNLLLSTNITYGKEKLLTELRFLFLFFSNRFRTFRNIGASNQFNNKPANHPVRWYEEKLIFFWKKGVTIPQKWGKSSFVDFLKSPFVDAFERFKRFKYPQKQKII